MPPGNMPLVKLFAHFLCLFQKSYEWLPFEYRTCNNRYLINKLVAGFNNLASSCLVPNLQQFQLNICPSTHPSIHP